MTTEKRDQTLNTIAQLCKTMTLKAACKKANISIPMYYYWKKHSATTTTNNVATRTLSTTVVTPTKNATTGKVTLVFCSIADIKDVISQMNS